MTPHSAAIRRRSRTCWLTVFPPQTSAYGCLQAWWRQRNGVSKPSRCCGVAPRCTRGLCEEWAVHDRPPLDVVRFTILRQLSTAAATMEATHLLGERSLAVAATTASRQIYGQDLPGWPLVAEGLPCGSCGFPMLSHLIVHWAGERGEAAESLRWAAIQSCESSGARRERSLPAPDASQLAARGTASRPPYEHRCLPYRYLPPPCAPSRGGAARQGKDRSNSADPCRHRGYRTTARRSCQDSDSACSASWRSGGRDSLRGRTRRYAPAGH